MQKNLFVQIPFVVLITCSVLPAFAQPSLERMKQKLSAEKQNTLQSFYKFEPNSNFYAGWQSRRLFNQRAAIKIVVG